MASLHMARSDPDSFDFSTPLLIAGGGLAGLYCALKLAPLPVTVITDAPLGDGASSTWAQGGIAAALSEGDDWQDHLADTILAGAGLVDPKAASVVVREARQAIEDLLHYGVPFDKDLEGALTFSREAAHSSARIVHVAGDRAGQAIMQALIASVHQTPSITVVERLKVESLITRGRQVVGLEARPHSGRASETVRFACEALILTTGGIGGLYAVTTNPPQAVGAGLALAARAGAVLSDCEFVQFHPTALNIGKDPAPLATEALRGHGAILVDASGQRLMEGQHADLDLAPRDIVARVVHRACQSGKGAFLDARKALGDTFPEAFPTVFQACLEAGLDPRQEVIPVAPAAHYHMGGILTDLRGRTSLDGLWAAGEVAATGMHGANRLASNSLLEAVVLAGRIAEDVRQIKPSIHQEPVRFSQSGYHSLSHNPDHAAFFQLRRIMAEHMGVERHENGLREALIALTRLETASFTTAFRNMALTALMMTAMAFLRRESRGSHQRLDYPACDTQARHSMMTLRDMRALVADMTG
jgi:L-aspartate oxidase